MSVLFFDTETSGLPLFRAPSSDPGQPHCVQIAAILTDDRGAEKASINLIVKPEGWEIPEAASNVHGITTEMADRYGIREAVASAMFYDLLCRADTHVAHNVKFDRQIVEIMFARASINRPIPGRAFCTADATAPICNLPPTARMLSAGFNKPKTPKLEEAYRHFFGEEIIGAHDALVDVRACMRIYWHLIESQGGAA